MTVSVKWSQHSLLYDLEKFQVDSLTLTSRALEGNYLGDSVERRHILLKPLDSAPDEGWPVVWHLSGLGSNGPKQFNYQPMGKSWVQRIDEGVAQGRWPQAVHVFLDGLTSLGGGQFKNSPWAGNYEDHLVREVAPALKKGLGQSLHPKNWLVTGGSSGGYGALNLASLHPDLFPFAAASAPDSGFEISLLPDIRAAAPLIAARGGVVPALEAFRRGEFEKNRSYFQLLNTLAMATCYSPPGEAGPQLPVDLHTGELEPEAWQHWLQQDPVEFLPRRGDNLRHLEGLYIDVGTEDQFFLYFGCRQLDKWLKSTHIAYTYREFRGNHFDISERRPEILDWFFGKIR